MNHIGLFAGIGGFEEAFRRVGANLLAVCEIDPQCQSVLRRHFPEAEVISDVKEITDQTFKGMPIDLITGGFPCQDLSVAGKRAGLQGERSGLYWEAVRVVETLKPKYLVLENVPGLLSSNSGQDMASVLDSLEEIGYICDVDILDAQYFGLAQRRRRVFIVCQQVNHLLQSRTISSALTITQCLSENLLLVLSVARAPLIPSLEDLTFDVGQPLHSLRRRMRLFGMEDAGQARILRENLAALLPSSGHGPEGLELHLGKSSQEGLKSFEDTKSPRLQRPTENTEEKLSTEMLWSNILEECLQIMSECITSTDASVITESKIFTCAQLMLSIARLITLSLDSCPTFWSAGSSALTALQGFTNYARQASNCLFTEPPWIQPWSDFIPEAERASMSLRSIGSERGEQIFSLSKGGGWDSPPRREAGERVTSPIRSGAAGRSAGAGQTANGMPTNLVRFGLIGNGETDASKGGNPHSGKIAGQFGVRRLMPVECERLQGFPGGWTEYGDDGNPISDSARYRMLGNAVAVPVVEWIARRIMKIDSE